MADFAGLVFGVIATWKTCVEIFDVVDSGKKYGMDYEVLRVKLEVERIRLLMWGNAVGLGDADNVPASAPLSRLRRDDVRATVMRLLGCIHHVFEHTDRLEDDYGLRLATPCPPGGWAPERPSQSQLILGTVFKRAYDVLRKSARDRQRDTPLGKKTLWAVHDKKKFRLMVSEIRGFNDSLESLFPEAKTTAAHQMRGEIEDSEDIGALQSLHEAVQEEHEAISDCASVRLEALGATTTASSRASDTHTATGDPRVYNTVLGDIAEAAEAADGKEETSGSESTTEIPRVEGIHKDLAREMKAVETHIAEKNKGCLMLSLSGPYHSARVTASTFWDGCHSDDLFSRFDDELKGFVKSTHSSFSKLITF